MVKKADSNRKAGAPRPRAPKQPKCSALPAVDRLQAHELARLLTRLLTAHPELREEAEAIAGEMLAKVSPLEIAEQVRTMMGWYGIDELNARAGDHGWGYVAPEEAADEILYQAIAGHVDDLKRKASAGYIEAAVAVCEGIVAGLYKAREPKRGSVLEWSPDFPLEAATRVIGDLRRACTPDTREAAVDNAVAAAIARAPDWDHALARAGRPR